MEQIDLAVANSKDWGIVVNSIGTTDANIVGALHKAIPVPEHQLALKIYQAPSLLLNHMEKNMADEINSLLNQVGLKTQVVHKSTEVESGDGKLEVCLVTKDYQKMPDILTNLQRFLGLPENQGKAMLFQSPNVIMGKVSSSTVAAIKQRFSALGVEVQNAEIKKSRYLLFVQNLNDSEKNQLKHVLSQYQLTHLLDSISYISHQVEKKQADLIWPHIKRFGSKVKLVNQNFAQFDIRLEAGIKNNFDTNQLIKVLEQYTEIPTHLINRVIEKAPIVIKRNIDFSNMQKFYQALTDCHAKVSVLPISMQYFHINIKQLGHVNETREIVRWMTECSEEQAEELTRSGTNTNILLTASQAHWLSYELEKVGTKVNLTLEQLVKN